MKLRVYDIIGLALIALALACGIAGVVGLLAGGGQ